MGDPAEPSPDFPTWLQEALPEGLPSVSTEWGRATAQGALNINSKSQAKAEEPIPSEAL